MKFLKNWGKEPLFYDHDIELWESELWVSLAEYEKKIISE